MILLYITINVETNCSVLMGEGPGIVVSTAAFHARARGSFPGLGGLKETKMFFRKTQY